MDGLTVLDGLLKDLANIIIAQVPIIVKSGKHRSSEASLAIT